MQHTKINTPSHNKNAQPAITILALGSNVGDRQKYLNDTYQYLKDHDIPILQASSVHETEPCYVTNQPMFLNQVIVCETTLSPQDLLKCVKQAEIIIGRIPTFRNGPREIDIDILFYDNMIVDQEDLIIPHPRLLERTFVLEPLCEIKPDLRCPKTNIIMRDALAELVKQN